MKNPFKRKPSVVLPSRDDLEKYHEKLWSELDPALQHKAISYLKAEVDKQLLDEISRAFVVNHDWMEVLGDEIPFYSFHFFEGMSIRNLLRDVIKDYELPTHNWDDYYVAALERAAGCR